MGREEVEAEMVDLLLEAIELAFCFFDTSELNQNEAVLGRALQMSGPMEDFFFGHKAGRAFRRMGRRLGGARAYHANGGRTVDAAADDVR